MQSPPTIPDHELIRCIGAGGYGQVWLARNFMGVHRAVKLVFRSLSGEDRVFDREYSGIQNFEPISRGHPHQVDILHVGRLPDESGFYYIMELADDETIGREVRPDSYRPRTLKSDLQLRHRLPVGICIALARQLAAALQYLHDRGLIHRDIKPSNISFVEGVPKLADPGLVSTADSSRSFVGTEGYVPPEGPATASGDIYSLGKVLYEAAAGLDRQQFPKLPDDLGQRPDTDQFLEFNEILLKACDPEAAERYRSVAELLGDLDRLEQGQSLKRLRFWNRVGGLAKQGALVAGIAALAWLGLLFFDKRNQSHRRQVADLYRGKGIELMTEGDSARALLWLTEALALDPGNAPKEQNQRVRIGAVLRSTPRVREVWRHPGKVNFASFDPSGNRVVTAGADGRARVWHLGERRQAGPALSHSNEVLHAVFSPDGRRVVSASLDGTARVWDAESGQPQSPPLRHGGAVREALFSLDGSLVFTASDDGTVRVWESTSGRARFEPLRHLGPVRDIALSRDGTLLASASSDRTARLWDIRTGEPATVPLPHAAEVNSVDFDFEGRILATSSTDHSIQPWSLVTFEKLGPAIRLRQSESGFRLARLAPDGQNVAALAVSRVAYLWDVETGRQLPLAPQHADQVNIASWSPDGRLLLTASADGTVKIWSPRSVRPLRAVLHIGGAVQHAEFSSDGRWILAADPDGFCKVWETPESSWNTTLLGHQADVCRARFSPDGTTVATASLDGTAQLWKADSGLALHPAFQHAAAVREAQYSADGSTLLTLSGEGTIRLWDTRSGQPRGKSMEHGAHVNRVLFNPDSTRICSLGTDQTARLWEAPTGQQLLSLVHHADAVAAAFNHSGSQLAVGTADGQIRIWDIPEAKPKLLEYRVPAEVRVLAFDPAGTRLAASSEQPDVLVWDLAGDAAPQLQLHHGREVLALQFRQDGRRLFTGGFDGAAMAWDMETGLQSSPPAVHGAQIIHMDLNHDTSWSVTTSNRDPLAKVWDVADGTPLAPFLAHDAVVYQAEFSPDNRHVVTAGADNIALIWNLEPDHRSPHALIRIAQIIASARIAGPEGLASLTPSESDAIWNETTNAGWMGTGPTDGHLAQWHEGQAAASERSGHWFSTEYHLRQVKYLQSPSPPAMDDRLARLTARRRIWGEGGVERPELSSLIPARPLEAGPSQIDLSSFYNAALTETWHRSIPFEGPRHRTDLSELPRGLHEFGGVRFDVRGVVQLACRSTRLQGQQFPVRVNGINLARKCRRLHALHASAWSQDPDGTIIGRLQLNLVDGTRAQLPLVLGSTTSDWWINDDGTALSGGIRPVWTGSTPSAARFNYKVGLFLATWENPRPEVEITSIDFVSAMTETAPFMVGLTAEE